MKSLDSDLYRICPVCERENPAQSMRCFCGASLHLVDFSVKSFVATLPRQTTEAPKAVEDLQCQHSDCLQPNPPGTVRCLYCNRPLVGIPQQAIGSVGRLPALLRARYREIELLPIAGSEADLLRVELIQNGAKTQPPTSRIVKLYRQGLQGDDALIAKIRASHSPHVVQFYEHGTADSIRFEVMEYCHLGSLRSLMATGPMSVERIRSVVAELAQGLSEVQSLQILHRDLKPENVLVRSLEPLSLALTDFGIASVRLATQHFTGGTRTTRYAAPEALTGVLDEKADWWSLGMIVLEAALGRHPFDGVNEQIVNYHLATKPIDTREVFHDDLRKLCRGLLLRDPKRRWGPDEIARWLAADASLPIPQEDAVAVALRPYQVGDSQCTNAVELAATLAKHWCMGCKDLARGSISTWVEDELHDHNLLRKVQDIQDMRGMSADWRLLAFILAAAPDIPAVWQGLPVSRESLLIAARKSTTGDAKARAWLQSIHTEGVLELLASAGRGEVSAFREQWRAGLQRFDDLWTHARAAEDRWSRAPKAWHQQTGVVVDVAYALYVQPIRMTPPSVERQHGAILLALALPAYVNIVRSEIRATIAQHAEFCPWFDAIGPLESIDSIGVMVAKQLLPLALEDTERERKHLQDAAPNQPPTTGSARAVALHEVRAVLEIARQGVDSDSQVHLLRATLGPAQEVCARFIAQAATTPDQVSFRNAAETFARASLDLQATLDQAWGVSEINAIWLEPQRLMIAAAIVVFVGGYLSGTVLLLGLLALGAAVGWRVQLQRAARGKAASKAKNLVRFGDKLMAYALGQQPTSH